MAINGQRNANNTLIYTSTFPQGTLFIPLPHTTTISAHHTHYPIHLAAVKVCALSTFLTLIDPLLAMPPLPQHDIRMRVEWELIWVALKAVWAILK